jgi:4-hydroxy-tetrahydrodipicolinate synthase
MKHTKNTLFDGVCTALATPFRDGAIDWEALGEMIETQVEGGVSAICICGTTGEAATLSDGERLQLVARAAELIDGRVDYLVGVGSPSTSRSVSFSRFAAAHGADALLVVTPYYNRGTHDGIVTHYKTIADSTELPVILYNVPSRTGVNLSVSHIAEIAHHPNIKGLKEAGDSLDKLADFMLELGGVMKLYSGNDSQFVPTLSLGGSGIISVLSNILPAETVEIWNLWQAGKVREAAKLQLTFLPLIRLLFAETNPAPLKCALEMLGLSTGELRLPLSPVSEELRARLAKQLGLTR